MKLLLDTHTFLWFVNNDANLSQNARDLIEDAQNQPYLSIASVWEIAIKINIGKLRLPKLPGTFINEQLKLTAIELLGITLDHTDVIASLSLRHRDPFDRMLVAQALLGDIPLLSADKAFDLYPSITRLW